jgi:hypothetical protein
VLLAGGAQVHVRVHEAGEQVTAGAVDHLGAGRRLERAGIAELGDRPLAHEHVVGGVEAGAGVEHVGAADQQVGGLLRAADQAVGGAHASCGAGMDGSGRRSGAPRPASSS